MSLHSARAARVLALAATIGAVAAPGASAIPTEQFIPSTRDRQAQPLAPVRVVEVSANSGFDWGDAGLGATGVLALAAIGAGAALATGHRPRLSHGPQAAR
jgi:hypothetical protein